MAKPSMMAALRDGASINYALRDRFGYGWTLAIFEGATIAALMIIYALGPEMKEHSFLRNP